MGNPNGRRQVCARQPHLQASCNLKQFWQRLAETIQLFLNATDDQSMR